MEKIGKELLDNPAKIQQIYWLLIAKKKAWPSPAQPSSKISPKKKKKEKHKNQTQKKNRMILHPISCTLSISPDRRMHISVCMCIRYKNANTIQIQI